MEDYATRLGELLMLIQVFDVGLFALAEHCEIDIFSVERSIQREHRDAATTKYLRRWHVRLSAPEGMMYEWIQTQ